MVMSHTRYRTVRHTFEDNCTFFANIFSDKYSFKKLLLKYIPRNMVSWKDGFQLPKLSRLISSTKVLSKIKHSYFSKICFTSHNKQSDFFFFFAAFYNGGIKYKIEY